MELLFSNEYYDNVPEGADEEKYVGRYAHELSASLSEFDGNVKSNDTNIGRGADWPVVLVEIFGNHNFLTAAGVSGLFFLGEKINQNLDAWLEIAGKLGALFRKVKPVRIDENAAMLIALNDAAQSDDKFGIVDVSVQVVVFMPNPSGKYNLDKRPDALYLVKIDSVEKISVYGVKSNGSVEFKHEYAKGPHEF